MKAKIILSIEGRSCQYEAVIPDERSDDESVAHALRVVQSGLELGLSLVDAHYTVAGESAIQR